MKYILRNIAQSNLPRTIIFFVLGVAMWIPSLLRGNEVVTILITMALTVINSLLAMQFAYRSRITNLPSGFVASTWWLVMSSIPALHTCWQAQFVALGIALAWLVLLKMDFHHEATEEAFLATLICCIVAVIPSILYSGIMMLWGYLIAKQQMTWRVWFASLIAIAIRLVTMGMLHYKGWLSAIWMENIPQLTWLQWVIYLGVFLLTAIATMLPMRRPSVGSGIFYAVSMILCITTCILWHSQILVM